MVPNLTKYRLLAPVVTALVVNLITAGVLTVSWVPSVGRASAAGAALVHAPAPRSAYLYVCTWKKQAVTLVPVKQQTVPGLPGARKAGQCASFWSDDPRYKKLLGKSLPVYSAAGAYTGTLLAYRARRGSAKDFGTWTFPLKPPAPPATTKVLPRSVVQQIVPAAGGGTLDVSKPDLALTFSHPSSQVQALKPGDTIVGAVSAATPDGLLRQVTSVISHGSNTVVDTVPANITRAFPNATINVSQTVGAVNPQAAHALQHGVSLLPHVRDNASFCPSFNNVKFSVDPKSPAEQSLFVSGNMCVTAGIGWQASWGPLVRHQSFTATTQTNGRLSFKYVGPGLNYTGELPLVTVPGPPIIVPILGVPTQITPQLVFKLGVQAQLAATISGGVDANGSFTAGIDCGFTCSAISSGPTMDVSSEPTVPGGTASIKVYGTAEIEFKIDGLNIGPTLAFQLYGKASSDLSAEPCWSVAWGLQVSVGAKFEAFGTKWKGDYVVMQIERPLAKANTACAPTVKLAADATSLPAGKEVTLTATANKDVSTGNYQIAILDADSGETLPIQGGTGTAASCVAGTTCVAKVTQLSPKDRDFKARILTADGGVLNESAPVRVSWTASLTVSISASGSHAPVGTHVDLEVSASGPPLADGSGILVTDSKGVQYGCPAAASDCTVSVTESSAGAVTYSAWVADASGNQISSNRAVTSIQWEAWSLQLTASKTDIGVGEATDLTASTNPDLPAGFTISIEREDGKNKVCPTRVCVWADSASSPGVHLYSAVLRNAGGEIVAQAPSNVSVSWSIKNFGLHLQLWFTNSPANYVCGASHCAKSVQTGTSITPRLTLDAALSAGYGVEMIDELTGETVWHQNTPLDPSCVAPSSCPLPSITYNDGKHHLFMAAIYPVTDVLTTLGKSDTSLTALTWEDWKPSLTLTPPTTSGGPLHIVATAPRDLGAAGLRLAIFDLKGPHAPGKDELKICGGAGVTTCPLDLTPQSGKQYDFVAVVDTYNSYVEQSRSDNINYPPPCATELARRIHTSAAARQTCPVSWGLHLSVTGSTTLPVNTPVQLSASTTRSLTGTGYTVFIAAVDTSPATLSPPCQTDSSCAWNPTSAVAATHTFRAGVYDPNGNLVETAPEAIVVTWQDTSGGGNSGCGSGWSIAAGASNTSPSAGSSVTITGTANQTTANTNCIIKIEDASNGYVYEQCGDSDTCSVTVPFQDFGGNTGCDQQGSGTCTYLVGVFVRGTSSNPVASDTVTVTWGSYVSSLPGYAGFWNGQAVLIHSRTVWNRSSSSPVSNSLFLTHRRMRASAFGVLSFGG